VHGTMPRLDRSENDTPAGSIEAPNSDRTRRPKIEEGGCVRCSQYVSQKRGSKVTRCRGGVDRLGEDNGEEARMLKVLVASDLSARSDRAVARSFALAKELRAELTVLHVVDADLPQELRTHSLEWARKALAREIETLAASTGAKSSIEVCAGHPSSEIVARADAEKVDLIVLGVHNQAVELRRIFSETTAGKIARVTRAPVLLVKEDAAQPYRRAVIGIDFSALSRAVFRQSLRIAPMARFYLVHAYHVPFKAFISDPRLAREITDTLNDQMELIGEWAQNAGIASEAVEKILQEGQAHQVLYAECERLQADLVVIGTHEATGVARAIWGSIAADLLDAPPCDVLIAKPYWS